MITSLELLSLTLGGDLENEKYTLLTVQPRGSFEEALSGEVCYYNHDWDDIHVCVGTLPHSGELGYLVRMVREIPTAHNIIGPADAIYEVDTTEGENLYYAVWAITNK